MSMWKSTKVLLPSGKDEMMEVEGDAVSISEEVLGTHLGVRKHLTGWGKVLPAEDCGQNIGVRKHLTGWGKVLPAEDCGQNIADVPSQDFGLGLKLPWKQIERERPHLIVGPQTSKHSEGKLAAPQNQREVIRQESDQPIDKQRMVPPEAQVASEECLPRVDHGAAQQLGLKRKKVAQKRIRVDEEEDRSTDDLGGSSAVLPLKMVEELNLGVRNPGSRFAVVGESFESRHNEDKSKACHLINKINEAFHQQPDPEQRSKLEQPLQIMFDRTLNWADLVEIKGQRGVMASGTYGSPKRLMDQRGRSVVAKELIGKAKSKLPQNLVEPNEVMVPLDFGNTGTMARVLGIGWDGQKATILQEDGGLSLRQVIECPQLMEQVRQPKLMKIIVLGIFKALAKLHKHGIKHRDIKMENITYDPISGKVLLIDLGSSRTPQDGERAGDLTYSGTSPEYLPPQCSNSFIRVLVHKEKHHPRALTEKSDVWGGGMVTLGLIKEGLPVTMYFLNQRDYPHHLERQEQLKIRLKLLAQLGELKDPLPDFFLCHPSMPEMEQLLRGCLTVDEDKRWTAQQAVNFLQGQLHESPKRKVCKLDNLSKLNVEAALNKLRVDETVGGQSFPADLGITPKNPQIFQKAGALTPAVLGINPKVKIAAQEPQFPPKLVSEVSSPAQAASVHPKVEVMRTYKVMPKLPEPQHIEPDPGDDSDLQWLIKNVVTSSSPHVVNMKKRLPPTASASVVRVAEPSSSAHSAYLFSGAREASAMPFTFSKSSGVGCAFNIAKASSSSCFASSGTQAPPRKLAPQKMVFSPLPNSTPSSSTIKPSRPVPVMGLWGQVDPHHQWQSQGQHLLLQQHQLHPRSGPGGGSGSGAGVDGGTESQGHQDANDKQDEAPGLLDGNIPNFLM